MANDAPEAGAFERIRNAGQRDWQTVTGDQVGPCCFRCGQGGQAPRYLDVLERVRLADDPTDPNCGHFYLETVHIVQCPACGHRQEHLHKRTPYATLREAQSQLDAHLLGKG